MLPRDRHGEEWGLSANREITSLSSCLCQGCEEAVILSHLRCRDALLLMGESPAHYHPLEKVLLTQSQSHFFSLCCWVFLLFCFSLIRGVDRWDLCSSDRALPPAMTQKWLQLQWVSRLLRRILMKGLIFLLKPRLLSCTWAH